jgi:hypothetical protein
MSRPETNQMPWPGAGPIWGVGNGWVAARPHVRTHASTSSSSTVISYPCTTHARSAKILARQWATSACEGVLTQVLDKHSHRLDLGAERSLASVDDHVRRRAGPTNHEPHLRVKVRIDCIVVLLRKAKAANIKEGGKEKDQTTSSRIYLWTCPVTTRTTYLCIKRTFPLKTGRSG